VSGSAVSGSIVSTSVTASSQPPKASSCGCRPDHSQSLSKDQSKDQTQLSPCHTQSRQVTDESDDETHKVRESGDDAVQDHVVQDSAVQDGTVQEDAVQDDAVHKDAVQENEVQENAVQNDTVQDDTVQDDTVQMLMGESEVSAVAEGGEGDEAKSGKGVQVAAVHLSDQRAEEQRAEEQRAEEQRAEEQRAEEQRAEDDLEKRISKDGMRQDPVQDPVQDQEQNQQQQRTESSKSNLPPEPRPKEDPTPDRCLDPVNSSLRSRRLATTLEARKAGSHQAGSHDDGLKGASCGHKRRETC
jgi:hypothetical protein